MTIICLCFLIYFCPPVSSSPKINNQALTIVKSIDDYLCQNFLFTCFFRQQYHLPLLQQQQQLSNCKYFLILHSCLNYDDDSINMCRQDILNEAKLNLVDRTPIYCFTPLAYKNFYAQHLSSMAQLSIIVNWQIFVLFFLFISFIIRIRMSN